MIKDPRITVATIVEQDDRFLLVEENCNGQIVFNQPAGHVEAGESFVQAALRETLEETAWTVEVTDFLGVYVMPMPANGFTYYRFCYVARPIVETEQSLDKDIISAQWLTHEQILAKQAHLRSPLVLQCLEDYRSGIRLPLTTVREFGGFKA